MSKFIEVAVSPFYNGDGWTDHGTGIRFEKTTLLKGFRIELKDDVNISGIRNSIRLNNLLLLQGELPENGDIKEEEINPAELTHQQYTKLLSKLREGGDPSDTSELEDELTKAYERIEELEEEVESLKEENRLLKIENDELSKVEEPTTFTEKELNDRTVAQLQELAEELNIELTATKKADIIQEILDAQ